MNSLEAHETMLQRAEEDDAAHNHNLNLDHDLNVRKVKALEDLVVVAKEIKEQLGEIDISLVNIGTELEKEEK